MRLAVSVYELDLACPAQLLYLATTIVGISPSKEQLGWDGKPRPQAQRRRVSREWPETLEPLSDTYMDQAYQGLLG